MPVASTILDGCIFVPVSGGTGSFVELTALSGYQTMEAAGAVDQQQASYRAQSPDLTQWEIGTGIWTASTKTLTRVVLFNSLGTTAAINFTNPPQVLITALGSDIPYRPIATSNLTWYVAATGNDNNPGTISAPFATIQHAVNVAALYDWQGQFFPTIQVGTPGVPSTLNQQGVVLPELINADVNNGMGAFGGSIQGDLNTPSNIVLNNTVGATFWSGSGPGCIWSFQGFRMTRPSGFGYGVFGSRQAFLQPGALIFDAAFGSTIYHFSYDAEYAGTNAGAGITYAQIGGGGFFITLQDGAKMNMIGETHVFPSTPTTSGFIQIDASGGGAALIEIDSVSWGNFASLQGPKLDVRGDLTIITSNGLLSDIPGVVAGSLYDDSCVIFGLNGGLASRLGPVCHPTLLNQQSGAGYTLASRDIGGVVEMTSGSANTVTVPLTFGSPGHVTGGISGTTFTVTDVPGHQVAQVVQVGDVLSGAGVTLNTVVTALGTGLGDLGTYTVSPSQTVTPGSTIFINKAAPLNSRIVVTQGGAGATTVQGATGVTIRTAAGFSTTLASQWSAATLYQRSYANAASEWVMVPGA